MKQPDPEIERTKPMEEPTPAPPTPVVETPQPTPAPTPEIVIVEQAKVVETPAAPKELPKTASPLSLFGLIGLLSTMTGYLTRYFRS